MMCGAARKGTHVAARGAAPGGTHFAGSAGILLIMHRRSNEDVQRKVTKRFRGRMNEDDDDDDDDDD
eukprot:5537922-Karenia_brevis.AAC.1